MTDEARQRLKELTVAHTRLADKDRVKRNIARQQDLDLLIEDQKQLWLESLEPHEVPIVSLTYCHRQAVFSLIEYVDELEAEVEALEQTALLRANY